MRRCIGSDQDYKEAMKLDNQLCFPIYAAARSVVSAYTPLGDRSAHAVCNLCWDRLCPELAVRRRVQLSVLFPELRAARQEHSGLQMSCLIWAVHGGY